MGFLQPNLPDLDLPTWQRGTRQERMRPLVRHFCEIGFGSPDVVTLVYVVKIGLYLLVGWLFVLSTPGIDGFFSVSDWWRDPIVFYKFVLWTMLFEVLGLGCGFGPLNLRFTPPLGSFLYWLRPGTIRLATVAGPGAADGAATRGRSSTWCCTPRCSPRSWSRRSARSALAGRRRARRAGRGRACATR